MENEENESLDVLDIEELAPELDETSSEFVDQLVKKLILFTEEFCNIEFFPIKFLLRIG